MIFLYNTISSFDKDRVNLKRIAKIHWQPFADKTDASAAGECTFESDLCNWTHINATASRKYSPPSATFWIRHRGPAPARSNGPTFDHTTGNDSGTWTMRNLILASLISFSCPIIVGVRTDREVSRGQPSNWNIRAHSIRWTSAKHERSDS